MIFNRRVSATINAQTAIPDGRADGLKSIFHCRMPGKIVSAKAHVNLTHTNLSQVQVNLISPSGVIIKLFNRQAAAKQQKGLDMEFSGNIMGPVKMLEAEGDWVLQVIDHMPRDRGILNWWKIELELRREVQSTEIFMSEVNATLPPVVANGFSSTITLPKHAGNEGVLRPANLNIKIDLDRTYINDLDMALKAPSGKTFKISGVEGWTKRGTIWNLDIHKVAGMEAEALPGEWALTVGTGAEKQQRGRCTKWGFEFFDHRAFRNINNFPNTAERTLHRTGLHTTEALGAAVPLEVSSILALGSHKESVELAKRLAGS